MNSSYRYDLKMIKFSKETFFPSFLALFSMFRHLGWILCTIDMIDQNIIRSKTTPKY